MSADRSIAVPRYRKEGYTRADLTYNYTRQNKHTADLFDGWDNGGVQVAFWVQQCARAEMGAGRTDRPRPH